MRLLEPTRDQKPSATAVFAWIMGPSHSKSRTPASSSGRYPARDIPPTMGQLLCAGTSTRTSTPSRAAAASASDMAGGSTKYGSVSQRRRSTPTETNCESR